MSSYYEKFIATGEVKCIDEEIPFEIPATWEWARINTIGISQLGKTLDRGKNIGQEYPYLCSINVYWDGIDLSKIKTFKLRDDELPKYRLHKGDLLICEGGDYGRCCVWDRDEEMYYQNALHRIRFYCGLFPIFYKFVFELYRNIGYIVGQGQTIKHFTYESMKSIVFPVPSISEQKRIVELLKEVLYLVKRYDKRQDALNYLNERINVKLQKSILQEAIQGKLVPQIAEEGTAEKLLAEIRKEKERLVKEGKLKKSVLSDSVIYKGDDNKYYELIDDSPVCIDEFLPFQIPETWVWCKVKDLLEIQTGASFKKEQANANKKGIRILRGGNILPNKYIFKDDDVFVSEEFVNANTILKKNSIITPAVTSLENIGKMAVIEKDYKNVSAGGFVFIISPYIQDFNHSLLLACFLQSPFLIEAMRGITKKSGAAFYNLGKERLKELYLPLPPMAEQSRVVAKIKEVLSSIMSR